MRLSKLGLTLLGMGTVTSLSVSSALADSVTIKPGQTLWKIAEAKGVSVQSLESANPYLKPMNLPVGSVVHVPTYGSFKYVVEPRDTLWIIANRFHTSVSKLVAANPSVNAANLLVGHTVVIPSGASTSRIAQSPSLTSAQTQNLYWMERVINAEAGGESFQAQLGVGDVIMHRLYKGSYGNTVHDVVFQISSGHYQFTSVANGYIYTPPNASSVQAAVDVLQRGEDVVPGAMVFYNPAKTPAHSWVWSQPTIGKIGHFVFAK